MCGLINKAAGRCLGGDRCLSGRTGGAGSGHTASPHTFAAQLPLGLLQPARLSQERLFPLACGLPAARVNSRLCLLESPRVKPGFVLASRSGCKAAPDPARPESPGRELRGGRGAPRETGQGGEGKGRKLGWVFSFLLRVALLDQKLKAVNIFLSYMPPSCWPAKLVS